MRPSDDAYLPNIVSASNAAVTFTIPAGTLSAGSNALTAAYTGDGEYAVSSGTTMVDVSQVVVSIPAPAPVAPGSSATATVTVATGSSYSGTVNLSCKLSSSPANAQSLPTCSLNPATLMVAAGANKTTTLSVNTTAASANLVWPLDELRRIGEGGLALAGLLMFGTSLRRRRWLSMLALVAIVVSVAGIGCGGNGGSPTPPATVATTAGTYVFTVTATDSTNASITASSTVSITIQ
jgi:trimeric autotransporter adhesin